ncbi:FKBP-type peptidyl-prolyl cis-trans isomerase [Kiritimatiellaeota bacterium B1221]|nr:FKBP-type peptidyl-prolyl cis-trans isomerase [Kiritimatiellaeota bacterium B1221]
MTQNIKAPADVAKAPADAMVTETGLASTILTPGSGGDKPTATSTVTVHYTGWKSSDGSMFDSSITRGQPASFPLNQVIPGWTEGLQLMVAGEKRRFWIPQELAYGPEVPGSGRPGGQLVFDVELISVEKGPEPIKVPADALKTESEIAYVITEAGNGETPKADQTVQFHFTFLDPDGKALQSSHQAGPQTAPMNKLPPFFTEVFSVLPSGAKADAYIPGSLLGAPYELVKCELELLEVKATIPAPPVPEDVAAAPADAQKTDSGLAYKVLSSADGNDKPSENSTVTVHYSGWETNGELFDSSVVRGETTSFPLGQVIKGWTEGLQLMSKGDSFRFWIPQDLAYGPKQEGSGRPGGLLVFDVELIDFK